jgi:two-component system sensor histidine kinase YesM
MGMDNKKLFVRHLNNISFKMKLLIFFFILIIVPITIITAQLYNNISSSNEDQILFSSGQVFEQTIALIQYKIKNVLNVSEIIAFDKETVQKILKQKPEQYRENYVLQKSDYEKLAFYITNLQRNEDIYKIVFYVDSELMYSSENVNFMDWDMQKDLEWYKELTKRKEVLLWFPAKFFLKDDGREEKVITAVRYIRDLDYFKDILGVMRIDIYCIIKTDEVAKKFPQFCNDDFLIIAKGH